MVCSSIGETENIIKSLKTKNSCGYNEIPIKTLLHGVSKYI